MDDTPVEIEFVRAQGMSVATAWAGSRDPESTVLVWLHGLGGSSTVSFAGIAMDKRLAVWKSLLIDLPGHGSSEAPDGWSHEIEEMADLVMAVVSGVTERPVSLFGHSMGGSVAIACAGQNPAAIKQLIVAEPNLDPGRGTISARIASQDEDRFVRLGYPALLRTTRMLANNGDVESREWLRSLELASPAALHRCSRSLLAERVPTFRVQLASVPAPVAMIIGERSSVEALASGDNLRGYVVPGAGHQMIAGNPDGFVRALVAAIQREPDPATAGVDRR